MARNSKSNFFKFFLIGPKEGVNNFDSCCVGMVWFLSCKECWEERRSEEKRKQKKRKESERIGEEFGTEKIQKRLFCIKRNFKRCFYSSACVD